MSNKIDELKGEISNWKVKLEALERQHLEIGERHQELEAERQKHVLGAMAEADTGAKHELNRLTTESEQVQRERSDYQMAIEQAHKKLDALQEQLAREEQEVLKGRIRALVDQRVQTGKQIESLVSKDLLPLLQQAKAHTDEVNEVLRQLGIERNTRSSIGFVSTYLLGSIGKVLVGPNQALGAVPEYLGKDLTELDQPYFARILELL